MSSQGRRAYLRHEFTKEQLHALVVRWEKIGHDIVDDKLVDMAEFDRLDHLVAPFGRWWSPRWQVARLIARYYRRKWVRRHGWSK